MADSSTSSTDQGVEFAKVARLVLAADGDTLYRDVYLHRAAEILSPFITEASFAAAVTSREQLSRLLAQARAAVARQDWHDVREVGARAAGLQTVLAADKALLDAAETVFAASAVGLDPLSPGLPSKRWSDPGQARAATSGALAELARDDVPRRAWYASRQSALDALAVAGMSAATTGGKTSTGSVEKRAMQALERGDAAALQSLADSMLGTRTESASGQPVAAARAALVAPAVLGEPLPEACRARAAALGLEAIETTLASPAVAQAIADFVERYALGASPAAHDRARDGITRLAVAAKDLAVPADIAAIFAETVSLMALHLYVNSAGIRYVPVPTTREAVLIEGHAEGDETPTALLRELGLDQRRACSRDDLENRLLHHGARIVGDHLGLDPLAFRLVCVPADIYMRVGRERGWGTRPEWTHFDGYQVMQGGRLRALVGGNSKFGGLYDFVSIARDDARENTVVRFAVVRRERLGVRIG